MRTKAKKTEVIKKFHDDIKNMQDEFLNADFTDVDVKLNALLKMGEIYQPIVDMYTEELNSAINPTSSFTMPIVIMLLRQMSELIEKKNPDAAETAEELNKVFPAGMIELQPVKT